MLETLRDVRQREYRRIWARVPGTVGVALLMLEVAMLGFGTGIWTGAVTIALLLLLTRVMSPTTQPVRLFLDLAYSTIMRNVVLRVLWLVLIIDLWVVQGNGPWAIAQALLMFIAAMVVPFAVGRVLNGVPALQAMS